MPETINWKSLAEHLGTLRDGGEVGGSSYARQVIESLIGEENLRQAVEYYIDGKPGCELARSVLWQIQPWSAMKHCYDIYKSDGDIGKRRIAVELLRVVADRRAMGWITEFLEDKDQEIQIWGMGLLNQLVSSGSLSESETEELLTQAGTHANPSVREIAASIRRGLIRD
ncbi:MAG TPA: hypothetical protein VF527_01520 [Pyrinomonadaceae bacterium]|jgi:hypothetical protein